MTTHRNLNENVYGQDNNNNNSEYSQRAAIISPLIFLVIVPLICLTIAMNIPFNYITSEFLSEFLYAIVVILVAVLFFSGLIPIAYGLYQALKPPKRFWEKGYRNLVIEFELLKKILFVTIPILVGLWLIPWLLLSFVPLDNNLDVYYILISLTPFGFWSISTVTGTAIRIFAYLSKKQFRLYYAKGCCQIISKKRDNFEHIKYLSLALDAYNDYLIRNTKFEIKDINRIKSIFIASAPKEKEEMVESICKSLECDNLELARVAAKNLGVPESELFVNESLLQKLKVWGVVLATAVPIAISMIQFAMSFGND